ncbi:uncharacterized protein PAC_02328 [Phialocephala subalpina]|uniref:NACHT-NTPase and P-loop NTPases N-terminal domain-containing protein n=1 Tax=Phialocephala subalpina TaxID=576137 RepID=A0A1L7WI69_9HELO|nr:uncharacterized protein PAC_02328 [Phialocephala subalpina]
MTKLLGLIQLRCDSEAEATLVRDSFKSKKMVFVPAEQGNPHPWLDLLWCRWKGLPNQKDPRIFRTFESLKDMYPENRRLFCDTHGVRDVTADDLVLEARRFAMGDSIAHITSRLHCKEKFLEQDSSMTSNGNFHNPRACNIFPVSKNWNLDTDKVTAVQNGLTFAGWFIADTATFRTIFAGVVLDKLGLKTRFLTEQAKSVPRTQGVVALNQELIDLFRSKVDFIIRLRVCSLSIAHAQLTLALICTESVVAALLLRHKAYLPQDYHIIHRLFSTIMDGLSGAASGIAVVSFTLQLAESATKLYNFWKSVDEAPEFVHEIVEDLKLLSTTLAEIALHEQKHGNNGSVTDILESCTGQIQIMLRMTTKIEHGLESRSIGKRKWTAIKAVFKEEKIAKFQQRLLNIKTTLLLARQTLSDRSIRACFDQNGQMLVAISQNMDTLREQNKQTSEIISTLGNTTTALPDGALEELLERAASHIGNPYMRAGFKKALEVTIRQAQDGIERAQDGIKQVQILRRDTETRDMSLASRSKLVPRQWRVLTTNCSQTMKSLFGDLTIQTTTFETIVDRGEGREHNDHLAQSRTRIIFRPAAWLVRFGLAYEFQLGLARSSRSWKTILQVFQPVPDDSLIFEFCRLGNTQGVQTLLSRKQASVWDTNSYGWTLLHIALHYAQLQIVELLLTEGADCDAVTYRQESCLLVFGGGTYTMGRLLRSIADHMKAEVEELELVFCILSRLSHQFESLPLGPEFICSIVDCKCNIEVEDEMVDEKRVVYWLKRLAQTLGTSIYTSEHVASRFWIACCHSRSTLEWAMSVYKDLIDIRPTVDGFSLILECIATEKWFAVEAFAKNGADLHYSGKDIDHSPVEETATSLSLYSSCRFFEWRGILRDLKIDIAGFIKDELQSSRLREDGWNAESLGFLFQLEFSAVDCRDGCVDFECGCPNSYGSDNDSDEESEIEDDEDSENSNGRANCGKASGIMVEVSWQTLLEKIKHGESLAGYIDKYSKDAASESDESTNFDRDIIETSEDESSSVKEITEDNEVDIGVGIDDDKSKRAKDGGDAEEACNGNTDDGGNGWEDYSGQDGSDWEEQKDDKEKEAPEWYCVVCWYNECDVSSTSPSVKHPSGVDSSEDESPMLLQINI